MDYIIVNEGTDKEKIINLDDVSIIRKDGKQTKFIFCDDSYLLIDEPYVHIKLALTSQEIPAKFISEYSKLKNIEEYASMISEWKQYGWMALMRKENE